ncbi:MAG: ABC transporter ATP-binding protein [Bacilli bacterium]|nr:ABC transporter ATP-binding protein [Bacilli bacterium]MBN2696240.1 ABC transporter ATP-binding protein [Bacilli bacterium]
MEKILEVKGLKTSFFTYQGEVKAVRGISFDLHEQEILGIVGESGSGKSVTSMSLIGLVDEPGRIIDGSVLFNGKELVGLQRKQLEEIRGKEISMIFQDPMTSLNPVFRIGSQIIEVILQHTELTRKEATEKAVELLKMVGIPEPETRIKNYPHQFSGGMRQRAMVAMALANNPKLLIADEPTTALDVTIQAQILDLMKKLNHELNTAIILITHDLGVVAETCDNVIVMYGGLVMEKASVLDLFDDPQHPYTRGLMQSVPKDVTGERTRLVPIEGTPPDLLKPPSGCPFSPRCPHTMEICMRDAPPLFRISKTQAAACWLHHKDSPDISNYVKTEGEIADE